MADHNDSAAAQSNTKHTTAALAGQLGAYVRWGNRKGAEGVERQLKAVRAARLMREAQDLLREVER